MPKKSDHSLDTIWIEAFSAVIVNGSFENAAKALGCGQSTISNRVAKLEGWLGASLFDRSEQRAVPNDLANSFHYAANAALDVLEQYRRMGSVDKDSLSPPEPVPIIMPDIGNPTTSQPWWKKVWGSSETSELTGPMPQTGKRSPNGRGGRRKGSHPPT